MGENTTEELLLARVAGNVLNFPASEWGFKTLRVSSDPYSRDSCYFITAVRRGVAQVERLRVASTLFDRDIGRSHRPSVVGFVGLIRHGYGGAIDRDAGKHALLPGISAMSLAKPCTQAPSPTGPIAIPALAPSLSCDTKPTAGLFIDLRKLSALQGQVVHQTLLVEDETDDGLIQFRAVERCPCAKGNDGD